MKKESIELGVEVSDKEEAIDRLVSLMSTSGRLRGTAGYKEGILAKEALGDTTIGEGIAIPHAKIEAVKEPGLTAMMVPKGVDYDAFDGSLADLLFMIAVPAEGADVHLEALSHLSTLLINPGLKERLIGAADRNEFLHTIDGTEVEHFGASEEETGQNAKEDTEAGAKASTKAKTSAEADTSFGYRVLAITVCPTGIAHAYMTVESLENTERKLGITLKAKTNGFNGARNVLTGEEITAADAIITAADRSMEMARSDRKLVTMVPIADGIHRAEELIKRAVNSTVPVYRHMGAVGGESMPGGSDSIGRTIYKHLMNGVSRIPPFVIGGGTLITLTFLLNDYSISPANFGKSTPLAAYLKTVGEQAFEMVLPILANFITMGIADRPGLTVGLVAGLIAETGATFANPAGGDVNAGFLDALFTGFASGYIVAGSGKLFFRLPKSLEDIEPVLLYPAIGIFLAAVITTFVSPYMGMVNDSPTHFLNGMGDISRIVLGIVLGDMMSIDIGGPFNKAAYVSGTTQLAESNFEVMATVMTGSMVPPIATALYTPFFKRKFTAKGRQSGIVNYVMGLSFITEGAIPFAVQDPLHVIPSCIIGSAIAGGPSMAFGYTLRAPHGGIFTLPTIRSPFMYLAVVVVGVAAGCMILRMLKKNAEEQRKIRYAVLRLTGEYLVIKI